MIDEQLDDFQERIGVRFNDPSLLLQALTHASFCNESKEPVSDNERLEFLGDAILNTSIAVHAFLSFPEATEGELTRMKALVVSEPALAEQARNLGIGDHLRLGKGAATGDKVGEMPSVLADTFESLIGAIFLDAGFEAAKGFVLRNLGEMLLDVGSQSKYLDCKSKLQFWCQKETKMSPKYKVLTVEGPSHAPTFTVSVTLPDGNSFSAQGKCKKEAEQSAAAAALEYYQEHLEISDLPKL